MLALALPGLLSAEVQSFFTVNTVNPLMVDLSAFTPKKNMDPSVTISNLNCGNILDPHPQLGLTICAAMVSVTRSPEYQNLTNLPLADPKTLLQKRHQNPFAGGPLIFFEHLLKHMLAETQIRHHLLQLPVLFFKLFHPPLFTHAQTTILLLPAIVGLFRDSHLPDYFRYIHPMPSLFQGKGNLLFRKPLHITLLAISIMPENQLKR
jgi:hypothetical protein